MHMACAAANLTCALARKCGSFGRLPLPTRANPRKPNPANGHRWIRDGESGSIPIHPVLTWLAFRGGGQCPRLGTLASPRLHIALCAPFAYVYCPFNKALIVAVRVPPIVDVMGIGNIAHCNSVKDA